MKHEIHVLFLTPNMKGLVDTFYYINDEYMDLMKKAEPNIYFNVKGYFK